MVTGGAVDTPALQHAVFTKEAGVAGLLTAPPLVAIGADTGSSDGVAFGSVAALATVGAVRPPEVAVTFWTQRTESVGVTGSFVLAVIRSFNIW